MNSQDKRFFTLNNYLRQQFGEKVIKVSLDAGFDCPNRDGTAAFGGCTFCSCAGSGDFAGLRTNSLDVQLLKVKQKLAKKWGSNKVIAYFQAFTNTHAPVAVLRERFELVLKEKNVVGLAIATRPDCLPDAVIEYLDELNKKTFLWVELGLQTIHDQTAANFNRAYPYNVYLEGVEKLRKKNISVCTHIINGLPNETKAMMLETVSALSKLDIQGIKIHLLHVLKNTPMARQYLRGDFLMLEKNEYINIVCDQLELLPENMVIHRLTGDGPPDLLIAPKWSLKKWEVLNAIDLELARRDSQQGKYVKKHINLI